MEVKGAREVGKRADPKGKYTGQMVLEFDTSESPSEHSLLIC